MNNGIIISTHLIDIAQEIADEILFINNDEVHQRINGFTDTFITVFLLIQQLHLKRHIKLKIKFFNNFKSYKQNKQAFRKMKFMLNIYK
ncbi:hypothetical protein [Clostridium sp.]|jgi:hypothetical protein|uniref:hypothetical protein n=1 Tax=Clostridium sp. TaxID=1506 RepID=UPI0025ECBAC5|nr:hypothetical protein [Clostridium sp.]MDY2632282.1 hypothetical protein [Clostridium sp.]